MRPTRKSLIGDDYLREEEKIHLDRNSRFHGYVSLIRKFLQRGLNAT